MCCSRLYILTDNMLLRAFTLSRCSTFYLHRLQSDNMHLCAKPLHIPIRYTHISKHTNTFYANRQVVDLTTRRNIIELTFSQMKSFTCYSRNTTKCVKKINLNQRQSANKPRCVITRSIILLCSLMSFSVRTVGC